MKKYFMIFYLMIFTAYGQHSQAKASATLLFSGFHNKETKTLRDWEVEVLDIEGVEIDPKLKENFNAKGRLDYVKIQVIKKNEIVYEVKRPSIRQFRVYFANGKHEKAPTNEALISAIVPIYGEGKFKIHFFSGNFWFNDKGEIIQRSTENKFPLEIDFIWPQK